VVRLIEQEGEPCGEPTRRCTSRVPNGQSRLFSSTALISAMTGRKAGPRIVPTNMDSKPDIHCLLLLRNETVIVLETRERVMNGRSIKGGVDGQWRTLRTP
jgi:hypothetical protein